MTEEREVILEDTLELEVIKNKKRHLNPFIFWFLLLIASIWFVFSVKNTPFLPFNWVFISAGALIILLALMYFLTDKYRKPNKMYVIRGTNIILSLALLLVALWLPHAANKVSTTIQSNTSVEADNTIHVNLYVLKDEYKKEHSDIFGNNIASKTYDNPIDELKAYEDEIFISQLGIDYDNQRIAIDEVKSLLGVTKLNMIDANSIQEGADALYGNKGQVLLLSDTNVKMLTNIEEYENFENETRIIYSIDVEAVNPVIESSSELTSKPFALFFGGNDEEGELKLFGKTDVDMVVVVNPTTHQIVLVSFPRDSYVPNPHSGYYADKLTHLGVTGIDNTLSSLSSLLDVNINNYVLLNFTTYMKIIDALGGVEVENPYAFGFWDNEDIYFPEGKIKLDGYNALLYVRERKTLPDGDFGRTMHQQLVMRAIIEKIASPAIITRFDSLMTAMEGTFLTNVSEEALYGLCQYQLENNIKWNIVNYRIEGSVGMAYCAYAPGTALSVVYPSSAQIDFVGEEIRKVLNGELVEQQEIVLPYGQLDILEIAPAPTDMDIVEDEETDISPSVEPLPEVTPEVTVEPEPTPEVTPEITPEITPEVTPEITPAQSEDTGSEEGNDGGE